MSTKYNSFSPMSSEDKPQQRLYEVVNLPGQPKQLNLMVELIEPLRKNYP